MIYKARAYKFGDNINTDFIISGRYKFCITDLRILSQHLFEDIRPNFYKELTPNESIIVAGDNFGLGSSREQAPLVIKQAGILCVIAKSFARIFYRNAFNIGLPLIETDTGSIKEADRLEINFNKGVIANLSSKAQIPFLPWNKFQLDLIKNNGIMNYLKKYGDFKL